MWTGELELGGYVMNLLELPLIAAIRRNHALEHATVNLLSQKRPRLRLLGRSDWGGFTLYGPADTEDVRVAVSEALSRLRAGEHRLAIHSRCGTNLATGVVLAGLATHAALRGRRRSGVEKAAELALGLGAAFLLTSPLGVAIQEQWTTSADVTSLRVVGVWCREDQKVVVHRIETARE
jgi:hypothetical protein